MASSVTSRSLSLFLFTSKPASFPSAAAATTHLLFPSLRTNACFAPLTLNPRRRGRSIIVKVDDADDRGGQDEYDMVNEEVEEVDNKKDYDVEYDRSDGGCERRRRWGHRVRADQELHIDAGVELGDGG
ncbi:PLASTID TRANSCRIPTIONALLY ACTIVE protein 6, chloroplastic-like [Brassica napus]|uniref:PLASTID TRANSCRIPTIONALLY ACTIVE protein 6, chloroplastic-like n=1 Tax=Brassica napus TaxID=3708 RepID=UPI002078F800|nr:PLASTID TRANSCRIPTIONALLY ACTIVE protein 6, chloroplastic-like [Brassica napus]